jgi:hypothetical protein
MESWFDRNKEHLRNYKRAYYQTHPEYREKKKAQALARYYRENGCRGGERNFSQ